MQSPTPSLRVSFERGHLSVRSLTQNLAQSSKVGIYDAGECPQVNQIVAIRICSGCLRRFGPDGQRSCGQFACFKGLLDSGRKLFFANGFFCNLIAFHRVDYRTCGI